MKCNTIFFTALRSLALLLIKFFFWRKKGHILLLLEVFFCSKNLHLSFFSLCRHFFADAERANGAYAFEHREEHEERINRSRASRAEEEEEEERRKDVDPGGD